MRKTRQTYCRICEAACGLLATVDNSKRDLRPGMFVEIDLQLDDDTGVLQVPASAVQQHENITFVFVARGPAEFERRNVVTGRSTTDMVEIVSGLDGGETVVEQGTFALKSELLAELMSEE